MTPSLSTSITGLLGIIGRHATGLDTLHFRRHAGTALGPRELWIPAFRLSARFIPNAVLQRLEQDLMHWTVDLGVRPAKGSGLIFSVVAATATFQRVYRNPRRPDSPHGKAWVWPDAEIAATIEKVDRWLPPTATIDARGSIVFLWSLDAPIRSPANSTAVWRHFQRIGDYLGLAAPSGDPRLGDLGVPVPGFVIHEPGGYSEIVVCPQIDLARVYSLDTIAKALDAAPAGVPASPSTATAPRRRTRPEATA
jgi:hypothetical protein